MNEKVIDVVDIRRDFVVGDETVHALRGVSFTIKQGEFVTIKVLPAPANQHC